MTAREKILKTLEAYGYAHHSTLEDNQYCANRGGVKDGAKFLTARRVKIATLQQSASMVRGKRSQKSSQSMNIQKNGLRKCSTNSDSAQKLLKTKSML